MLESKASAMTKNVREIVTDRETLLKPLPEMEELVWPEIERVASDLLDTAEAHQERCIGLAANQIGETERVIVALFKGYLLAMVNPRITKKFGDMATKPEGCMSVPSSFTKAKKKRRYKKVRVEYIDLQTRKVTEHTFTGIDARVVQHEIDHLNGILI